MFRADKFKFNGEFWQNTISALNKQDDMNLLTCYICACECYRHQLRKLILPASSADTIQAFHEAINGLIFIR